MIKVKIKESHYRSNITLIICPPQEAIDFFKKHYKTDIDFFGYSGLEITIHEPDKGNYYFIWLEKMDWKCYQFGILAHEILHLVFDIMRHIGMEYNRGSEEAYTYLMGRLYTEVAVQYHKLEKKLTK